MQVRLDIGEGKWLVFEDYGEKRKHLKVSVKMAREPQLRWAYVSKTSSNEPVVLPEVYMGHST